MNGTGLSKEWTDEQWSRIQQAVHDEARKARVAGRFLPLFGPLPGDAATVPAHRVATEPKLNASRAAKQPPGSSPEESVLAIHDTEVLPLVTVAINVFLTSTQQADPDLSSALTLFIRAANIIARIEDAIIFKGEDYVSDPLPPKSEVVSVSPKPQKGMPSLLNPGGNAKNPALLRAVLNNGETRGQGMVRLAAKGISTLDARGFQGPYALVLSQDLFIDAENPEGSLVLPSDRIRPLIEGPLLRSTILPRNEGILVSLAGNPIEIVVANDIHVRFLQLTTDPLHVYRVSEKFVLRIKESDAVLTLKLVDEKNAKDLEIEAAQATKAAEAHLARAVKATKAAKAHKVKAAEATKAAKAQRVKAAKARKTVQARS
jgi:uncharacterized linocin/CFP29 family protein